jgi:exo-beta-1,3-glucanase (GH17 family)
VIRNIAVGSEPLYDWVMDQSALATQIYSLKSKLSMYGMQVSMSFPAIILAKLDAQTAQTALSDLPYGYQSQGNAPDVFKAVDIVEGNVLPFFDGSATTGGKAWGVVSWSISYFQQYGKGKLIRCVS